MRFFWMSNAKQNYCTSFYWKCAGRSTRIDCDGECSQAGTWTPSPICFALYILSRILAFKCRSTDERLPRATLLRRSTQTAADTPQRTSFIHISSFSPSSHRKPPFPGVQFFSLQGELKRRWGLLFFFFLPFSPWMTSCIWRGALSPGN